MPNSSCTVRTIRGSYFSAVKEHDLTRRRQVSNIALEIPLCTLFFGRLAESRNATAPRIHMFYKTLDRATLARRGRPLERRSSACHLLALFVAFFQHRCHVVLFYFISIRLGR